MYVTRLVVDYRAMFGVGFGATQDKDIRSYALVIHHSE